MIDSMAACTGGHPGGRGAGRHVPGRGKRGVVCEREQPRAAGVRVGQHPAAALHRPGRAVHSGPEVGVRQCHWSHHGGRHAHWPERQPVPVHVRGPQLCQWRLQPGKEQRWCAPAVPAALGSGARQPVLYVIHPAWSGQVDAMMHVLARKGVIWWTNPACMSGDGRAAG